MILPWLIVVIFLPDCLTTWFGLSLCPKLEIKSCRKRKWSYQYLPIFLVTMFSISQCSAFYLSDVNNVESKEFINNGGGGSREDGLAEWDLYVQHENMKFLAEWREEVLAEWQNRLKTLSGMSKGRSLGTSLPPFEREKTYPVRRNHCACFDTLSVLLLIMKRYAILENEGNSCWTKIWPLFKCLSSE